MIKLAVVPSEYYRNYAHNVNLKRNKTKVNRIIVTVLVTLESNEEVALSPNEEFRMTLPPPLNNLNSGFFMKNKR